MSDLVLTIESDGEGPLVYSDSERGPASAAAAASKAKAKGKKQHKKREKLALEKGKKRARDEDDEAMADKMDAGFQFDAFGGGELGAAAVRNGSKKYGRTDAWVSQAQTCKAELLY
jgi:hypothetical protein